MGCFNKERNNHHGCPQTESAIPLLRRENVAAPTIWNLLGDLGGYVELFCGSCATLLARVAWLQQRRGPELIHWLEGDPEQHDPKAAGYWLYGTSASIGSPFDSGPWQVIDGKLARRQSGAGIQRHLTPDTFW